MSFSKTLSGLPAVNPFTAPNNLPSSPTVARCLAPSVIGDFNSPISTWTVTIVNDGMSLTNTLNNSTEEFVVPIGSINPTVCFDLDNNPVIAFEYQGTILLRGSEMITKQNGSLTVINSDNMSAFAVPGATPKLISSKVSGTYKVYLFFIQQVGVNSFISVLDLSKIGNSTNCTPTGIEFISQISAVGVESPSSSYRQVDGFLSGPGTPFIDENGFSRVYNSIYFSTPTDFTSCLYTGPLNDHPGTNPDSKIFLIYGDFSQNVLAEFVENGIRNPGYVYMVFDLQTLTVDFYDEINGEAYIRFAFSDIKNFYIIGYNSNLYFLYTVENSPFVVPPATPNTTVSVAIMPNSGVFMSGHELSVGVFPKNLNPGVLAGDQLEYSVNGIRLTFIMPDDGSVEFAISELMNDMINQHSLDPNFQYFRLSPGKLFVTASEWVGVDISDFDDSIKQRLDVILHMDTASQVFKDAFGVSTGDLSFHSCGGFSTFDPGPIDPPGDPA